ncbi:MAG TPA: sugar ABC transporter permease [Roseiarcus sp.]|nr:sugar ABC transporter permease [Roseiarcus sp.]
MSGLRRRFAPRNDGVASPAVIVHGRRLSYQSRRRLFLILLGAPALIYVVAIALWPLARGIGYSFYDYSLLPARTAFVGLDNYAALWTNEAARQSIVTTAVFTIAAVALEFALGLGLALLLWRDHPFQRACLALLLIPVTVTPIVAGLVFRALLAPDYGLIGYYLATSGLSSPHGLFGDPTTALSTLVAVDAWQWSPFMALILLAGLKSLPTDILEAAEADGATALQRFRMIVFPMLLPAVFLALVLRTMDAFRIFDIVFATTNGGPADATNVLMIYAVKQGLEFFNIGFASAIANLMILCIAVFSILFIALVRRADKRANEL